jgi:hypothetical protein
MRLKCCGTHVLDRKGVYCSAHNAAVPSGIRDSESVRRTGPDTDKARKPACSRVCTAADEGGSGGGCSTVVFRLSWRRRLSLAAAASTTAFLAAAAAFWHPESSPNQPGLGGLASVVLLVGGAGLVIVLIILAAGAGVAGVAGVALDALGPGRHSRRPRCHRRRLGRRRRRARRRWRRRREQLSPGWLLRPLAGILPLSLIQPVPDFPWFSRSQTHSYNTQNKPGRGCTCQAY